EARDLLEFFFFDPLEMVEVLHLAGDFAIESGGIEMGDWSNAAASGDEVPPAFLRADTQRADQSNTRDNYPASQRSLPCCGDCFVVTYLWRVCRYIRRRLSPWSFSRRPRRALRCRRPPQTPSLILPDRASRLPSLPQTTPWASFPLHPRQAARR